jgi:hypothetical protein
VLLAATHAGAADRAQDEAQERACCALDLCHPRQALSPRLFSILGTPDCDLRSGRLRIDADPAALLRDGATARRKVDCNNR